MGKAKGSRLVKDPHPHAVLIDQLGGPVAVSNDLRKRKIGGEITPQAVSNWKRRGVSIYLRNIIAQMLIEGGFRVPKGFTESRARGW